MTGGVVKHGHAFHGNRSVEHRAWTGLKQRCTNPKNPKYLRYGARGISVCNRWLSSFENFLADMGARPGPGFSIERKDNDGNYEPTNCVWASRKAQQRNRSVNRVVNYCGTEMSLAEAIEVSGTRLTYEQVYSRLKNGFPLSEALTVVLHSKKRRIEHA